MAQVKRKWKACVHATQEVWEIRPLALFICPYLNLLEFCGVFFLCYKDSDGTVKVSKHLQYELKI